MKYLNLEDIANKNRNQIIDIDNINNDVTAVAFNLLDSIQGLDTVLDLNSGDENFLNKIKAKFSAKELQKNKETIRDIPSLFSQASFDAITCLNLIENIPNSELDFTLKTLLWGTKKYVIVSLTNYGNFSNDMELINGIPHPEDIADHIRDYFKVISMVPVQSDNSRVYLLEGLIAKNDELQFDQEKFSQLEKNRSSLKIDGLVDNNDSSFVQQNEEKSSEKIESKDTSSKPFFSVVVPTYNQAEFLGIALDTIINQTYTDWEAIVVNDGSKDNTAEVMEAYAKRDSRIKCFHKENGGAASALNEGIKNTSGEWICWLSSDDFFEPHKLQVHYDAIQQNPDIKFFYSHWYLYMHEKKEKIAPPLWFPIPEYNFKAFAFFLGNYISGNTIAIHNSVIEKVGMFDLDLWAGQDFDFWLRISAEFDTMFINSRTITTRLHEAQTTNLFQSGGVFDSARSIFKFLNNKRFSEYFPQGFLETKENVIRAIDEIVTLYKTQNAFIWGLGFNTFLSDRFLEWLYEDCNKEEIDYFLEYLKSETETLKYILSKRDFNQLKDSYVKEDYSFKQINYFDFVKDEIKKCGEFGGQGRIFDLEKYLLDIVKREKLDPYKTVLYGQEFKKRKHIALKDIISWDIVDKNVFAAKHNIVYKCDCGNKVYAEENVRFKVDNSTGSFICVKCKTIFSFEEADFFKHLRTKIHHQSTTQYGEVKKILFLTRDSHIVGGGNSVIHRYSNWLVKLGFNVKLFSFGFKPDSINPQVEFESISSMNQFEIPEDEDFIVIAGSIFEIPRLIKVVNPSRVFLLCQGYEGYHYGGIYQDAVADKYFLENLHRLPYQVISVSTHLVELFKRKFDKHSFYIPNGIKQLQFVQKVPFTQRDKKILFVGNPSHPLKGFDYLFTALQNISLSGHLTEPVKLIVATGGHHDNIERIYEIAATMNNVEVEVLEKISSDEMVDIINDCRVLVCSSWYEGFSLPVVEAMKCGTPVITTANQGVQSFAIDNYNSFVVNFGDMQSLQTKLFGILFNQIDVSEIISNGLKTASIFNEFASFRYFCKTFESITRTALCNTKCAELEKTEFEQKINPNNNNEILENKISDDVKYSIVIPTYNRPDALRKALNSIKEQTVNNYEVIVVNDGQEDVTNVIKEFNSKFNYTLITHKENRERSISRNDGIKRSKGDYILFLDDDDIFYPEHIETFEQNLSDKYSVLYSDANRAVYYFVNGEYVLQDKYVPYSIEYTRNKLYLGNISPINCFCIKKTLFDEVGLFTEFINVLEDWELLIRLASVADFKHIKKITCEVNWYSESTTTQQAAKFAKVRGWLFNKYKEELSQIPEKEKAKITKEFSDIWNKDATYNKTLLSIVIPTFNQWKYTKQTIDSIKKFTKSNYEIIITDNASTDGTVENLMSEYPQVKVISNSENYGFPKAVNQGIIEAEGEHILIANNDIIFTEGWLDRMIELIESDPKIGIVGPISNSVSGYQIDENAKYKSIPEMHTYADSVRKKNKGKILDFPRVAFLCTLIKKEVIEKIGGLDERFSPGNYEDDDYCLRAQLAGYKTVIAQDVFIHHFGSKSFKADGDQKYIERLNINKEIFVDKWGADPNDIWLHSKEFNNRKFTVPISKNKFKQNFERGMQYIEEQELELAAEAFMNSYEFYDEFIETSGYNVPKTEILNLAGNVFLALNLFEEANILFENQLKLDPESGEACLGLGQVFYEAELYNEAKTMFEYAAAYLPDNPNAVIGLQKSNEALGLKNEGILLAESNNLESGSIIEDLIDRGELTEAKLAILDELSINGDDTYLLNNLVVINIMQEKYNESAKLLEKILIIEPNNETALNNLMFLEEKINSELNNTQPVENVTLEQVENLIENGELKTAKEALKNILLENPQNLDALNNLVVLLILEGKYDKASEAILEIFKIDPTNETAKDNLIYLEELINNELSEGENK